MTRANKRHTGTFRLRGWHVAAGLAGVVLTAAWSWRAVASGEPGWLASTFRSSAFATDAIIVISAAVLLAALAGMPIRAGRLVRRARSAGARSGQDGVAMIEFALVLPIALILSLIMAQSALLMVGHLCVHYSAYCAARSAIVYVPLGYEPGRGEGRNVLIPAKLNRIKDAAVWAILPVASSSKHLRADASVALLDGIEDLLLTYGQDPPHWVRSLLARKLYYAEEYTEVWLDEPENPPTYRENETINAHVKHVFHMSVPYASRIYSMVRGGDGVKLDFGADEYGMIIHASSILTNEGVQDYIEPEEYPQ